MKKFKVIYHVGKETVTNIIDADDMDDAVLGAGLGDYIRVDRGAGYAILIPEYAITTVTVEEEPEE